MAKLDIKIVKSKKDIKDLDVFLDVVWKHHNNEPGENYIGLGRVGSEPVAYWTGNVDDDWFLSRNIYVRKEHRGNGYGNELKEHQLRFAKSLGCVNLRSMVVGENSPSLAIQHRLGGKPTYDCDATYFDFDLTRVKF